MKGFTQINVLYDGNDYEVFKRKRYQRLSDFVRSVRKRVFHKFFGADRRPNEALIVYIGDEGKSYEAITAEAAWSARDFDNYKFKQLYSDHYESRKQGE